MLEDCRVILFDSRSRISSRLLKMFIFRMSGPTPASFACLVFQDFHPLLACASVMFEDCQPHTECLNDVSYCQPLTECLNDV